MWRENGSHRQKPKRRQKLMGTTNLGQRQICSIHNRPWARVAMLGKDRPGEVFILACGSARCRVWIPWVEPHGAKQMAHAGSFQAFWSSLEVVMATDLLKRRCTWGFLEGHQSHKFALAIFPSDCTRQRENSLWAFHQRNNFNPLIQGNKSKCIAWWHACNLRALFKKWFYSVFLI